MSGGRRRQRIKDETPFPASESLGYRQYRAVNTRQKAAPDALFAGAFAAHRLSSGVTFWRSDLTALSNHEQHAVVDRSLMVRMLLSPSPTELELDGVRNVVRPNEIFAYRAPETVGGVSRSYDGERYKCLGLQIQPALIADWELAERVDEFLDQPGAFSLTMTPSIAALANELVNGQFNEETADLLYESFALNVIARCFDPSSMAPRKRRIKPGHVQLLLRARDYINAHASTKLTMQSIADEVGMSVTTFKQKYRDYFDETPFETVRGVRLDRAASGLSDGRLTVTQAAYQSGYAHVSTFSDAFLKRFGRRPGVQ